MESEAQDIKNNQEHHFQPVEEWGLDPTYWSCRKLFIATIRDNVIKVDRNGSYLFYMCGRGISKVEIMGWITIVQHSSKRVTYYVDDGTSSNMRCTKFYNTIDPQNLPSIAPGDLVCVKGTLALSETNDEPYGYNIQLNCIERVTDPNMEVHHWLSCIHMFQNEYSKCFT